jgi:hypothetical protein
MENAAVAFASWPPELLEEGARFSPELTMILERGLVDGRALPPALRSQKAAGAFQQAFDLIGGVPRLALWADQNPSKFYPLYSKLMPHTVEAEVKHEMRWNVPWLNRRNMVTYEAVEDTHVLPSAPANDS